MQTYNFFILFIIISIYFIWYRFSEEVSTINYVFFFFITITLQLYIHLRYIHIIYEDYYIKLI